MPLAIVLPRERLPAYCAYERPLVGVRAQVRAQVVRTCETLRAEMTLERGRVFLRPFGLLHVGTRPLRIGKVKNVVAVGY